MGVASRAPKMCTYRGTKPKTGKYFFSVQFITRRDTPGGPWLGIHLANAGDLAPFLVGGTKTPHAPGQRSSHNTTRVHALYRTILSATTKT